MRNTALRQKGMDLDRDTNFIQTGGAPETFLGVGLGSVDAASLTTPQDTRAAFMGYNYVIDGRELKPPYVATGFVTLALGHRQTAQGDQPVHAHDGRVL